MREWPDTSVSRTQLKALEEEGDRITHDIHHRLHSTDETPVDREDIHALAGRAGRRGGPDRGDRRRARPLLHRGSRWSRPCSSPRVLRDAGAAVAAALATLQDMPEMTPHLEEVDRLEDEGDRISRQALVALFAGGIDPMVVIRWKDVFERLEQAIDACEHVAHLLEGIAVKHR